MRAAMPADHVERRAADVLLISAPLTRATYGLIGAVDSPEMKAMVAYFNWLSAGLPQDAKVEGAGIGKVDTNLVPDPVHGKQIYEAKCAVAAARVATGMAGPIADLPSAVFSQDAELGQSLTFAGKSGRG